MRRGEPNPLRRTAEQVLGASSAYETYQNQLFQTNKAIEVLTRRTNNLGEAQETLATTAEDTLSRAFQSLTDSASGTDAAIAEALQQFENANVGSDDQATDLARDIGSQLVSIAEATTSAQVRQAYARVEAYARDNSLIVAEDENLKALLLATEEAFQSRLNTLIASEQQQRFATDRFQAAEGANQQLRSIFEQLRSGDLGTDQLRSVNTDFETSSAHSTRLGVVVPNIEHLREQITGLANQGLAQINRETFATGLAQTMQEANTESVTCCPVCGTRSLSRSIAGIQPAVGNNLYQPQNIGVVVPDIEQMRTSVAGLADQNLDDQLSHLQDTVEAVKRNTKMTSARNGRWSKPNDRKTKRHTILRVTCCNCVKPASNAPNSR